MLRQIGVACRHQGQYLRACVGHIFGGIDPILEKEEKAENEPCHLAVREEIDCEKKWNEPLQQCATPEAQCGSKPAKEVMTAFVNHQVGIVNEKRRGRLAESVDQKGHVEDEPGCYGRARDWFPGSAETRILED